MDSLQYRNIRITIKLGITANHFNKKNDTIILDGYRVTARIVQVGNNETGSANIEIYGMAMADMDTLTFVPLDNVGINQDPGQQRLMNHQIIVEADGALAFVGIIVMSSAQYNAQPDVFLNIQATSQYVNRVAPYAPSNPKGVVTLKSMFARFAKDMALNLEDNGITGSVENLHLIGSIFDQCKQLANDHTLDIGIDGYTLIVSPRGKARKGKAALLNETSGLVGYPNVDNVGMTCRALFSPSIRFMGNFKLETDVKRANGFWTVQQLRYTLESQKPNGEWFMDIRGVKGINYAG